LLQFLGLRLLKLGKLLSIWGKAILYNRFLMHITKSANKPQSDVTVFAPSSAPTPISTPCDFFQYSNNKGPLTVGTTLPYSDISFVNLSNNLSAALNFIMKSTSSPSTHVSSE
jgi:hypothetical protein